jgi:hypothetical protein
VFIERARNPPREGIANSRRDVFAATHDRGTDRDKLDLRRRRRIQRRLGKETAMVRANVAYRPVSLLVETAARAVHAARHFSHPNRRPLCQNSRVAIGNPFSKTVTDPPPKVIHWVASRFAPASVVALQGTVIPL